MRDDVFKKLVSKDVYIAVREEAVHRTNEAYPLGTSAWDQLFDTIYTDLKMEYVTSMGHL